LTALRSSPESASQRAEAQRKRRALTVKERIRRPIADPLAGGAWWWIASRPLIGATRLTIFTRWCYDRRMKRATITIPEDLAAAVEGYVQAQETRPALTAVVQTALRQFLTARGYLRARPSLRITPGARGSGRRDVSQDHDRYLAGK